MNETWLPVPGYADAYEVSDLGRVRSIDRYVTRHRTTCADRLFVPGRLLKGVVHHGYLTVGLYAADGIRKHLKVHRLVLLAFVGPPADGQEACHGDDDKTNNLLSNLRWDTRSANCRDRVRNGKDAHASMACCEKGHVYDEANTYVHNVNGRVWRGCRTCRREYARRYRAEKRAA